MKTLALSDAAHAALERLAAARNMRPADLVAALVMGGHPLLEADPLLLHLAGPGFTALTSPGERYLALLAWVAEHHAGDFAEFIAHQESAFRYLTLGREEVREVCARNRARPIGTTSYWAVLAIDDGTRARFVRRLLEFVGCHDETVQLALRALGLAAPGSGDRLDRHVA